ncbi:hypothetical protein IJI99_00910 [bacterium]|nr:hypothetical protein [bacterium]
MTNKHDLLVNQDAVSVSKQSSAHKKLLNSYLRTNLNQKTAASADKKAKTSTTKRKKSSTNKKSTKTALKRTQVKQLGDLSELLPDQVSTAPSNSTNSNSIKQLGSIQSVLEGHTPIITPTNPSPINPYAQKDLFKKAEDDKLPDTSAFAIDSQPNVASSSHHRLQYFGLAVFGIGACIFGINQLIENAGLNFASEGDTNEQQPAVAPPRILTFQGRLTDFDQMSVTEPKKMRFTLYNTSGGNTPPPVGGEVLWDSNVCTVTPNKHGIFTVTLGAGSGEGNDDYNCGVTLGNIFAQNSNVWLQITVEDEVLFPRQLIKSVPYALNSETLHGYSASQSATANTIPVLDADGNLNFGTENTSITNIGNLSLASQTGDLYLLPGGGTVSIGNNEQTSNLFVTGDATVSGQLNLASGDNSTILYGDNGLFFKSQAGQNSWFTQATIDKRGYLGLGTTTPTQKLTLNQGNIAFEFTEGPELGKMTLTEDITDSNALRRIDAPNGSLTLSSQNDDDSGLSTDIYRYAYTFVTSQGTQTALSPVASFDLTKQGQSILISNLQTSSHPSIVARNLYRAQGDSNDWYLVKTIRDNTTTTTIDNASQNQLSLAQDNFSSTGNYRYRLTYVTTNGETNPSEATSPLTVTGDGRVVKVSNIPTIPTGSNVISRRLYRSLADSDQYYLVADLTDNNVTTIYDNLNDYNLVSHEQLASGGNIYTNGKLSLQFNTDGSIVTGSDLTIGNRVEVAHGDNQGLKLPTSIGKPFVKVGQKVGDIVYDTVGQVLYIYNGQDFVPTGLTNHNSVNLSSSSNCTGNSCRLVLDAEYAGAVITGDGSNNNGTFTSGAQSVDDFNFNYYSWQSADAATLNDLDTTINFSLPQNFDSWQENGLTLDFATDSTNSEDNAVTLEVYRGGTNVGATKTNLVSQSSGAWMSRALGTQPATISGEELSSLGFSAGDLLTIKIKTASRNSHEVKIGQINLNYQGNNGIVDSGSQSLWKQVAGAIFPADTSNDLILGGDSTASAKIGFFNLAGQGTPTLFVRGNLFLSNPNQENYLDLAESSSFNIRTINTDQTSSTHFTILPNGNIGIGTTTPTEKLEVEGNVKINGSLQLQPIDAATAGPCDANGVGKIYYDTNNQAFFSCQANVNTGTYSWKALN